MKKVSILTSIILASSLMVGCSSNTYKHEVATGFVPGSCVFDDGSQGPDWLCARADLFPSEYWFVVGRASSDLVDGNFKVTVAEQNARILLARRANVQVNDSFEQTITNDSTTGSAYTEIAQEVVSRTTTDVQVPNAIQETQTVDPSGNFYILMKVKASDMKERMKQKENMLLREFNAELKRKKLQPVESRKNETEQNAV